MPSKNAFSNLSPKWTFIRRTLVLVPEKSTTKYFLTTVFLIPIKLIIQLRLWHCYGLRWKFEKNCRSVKIIGWVHIWPLFWAQMNHYLCIGHHLLDIMSNPQGKVSSTEPFVKVLGAILHGVKSHADHTWPETSPNFNFRSSTRHNPEIAVLSKRPNIN